MNRKTLIAAGVIIALLVVGYFIGQSDKEKTLTIVSVPNSLSEQYMNYVLYVPGGKSTCNWSWQQSDGPQTFTTQGDGPNAEHDLMYPKDGHNFSNPAVSCLSDNGTTYHGIFP